METQDDTRRERATNVGSQYSRKPIKTAHQ
jgi:hypothetical protein